MVEKEFGSLLDCSDAAINCSERVSRCRIVSSPLLMQSSRLSKLVADYEFMVLKPFMLCAIFRSSPDCPDSYVLSSDIDEQRIARSVRVSLLMPTCCFPNDLAILLH